MEDDGDFCKWENLLEDVDLATAYARSNRCRGVSEQANANGFRKKRTRGATRTVLNSADCFPDDGNLVFLPRREYWIARNCIQDLAGFFRTWEDLVSTLPEFIWASPEPVTDLGRRVRERAGPVWERAGPVRDLPQTWSDHTEFE